MAIASGKQKRKSFALFYAPAGKTPEIIGKGIESVAIEQSPTVESTADVLGNVETELSSYEKTTELDPIYVTGGNLFSEKLDEIEEKELILEDVVQPFIWAKLYKTAEAGKYVAWKQDAVIELTSFGGDTKGVACPCTLHWIGERTFGTFDPATKTFAPDGGAQQLVTFLVKSGSNAVSGAKITVNNGVLTTNGHGVAEVELPTGSYAYTVMADGMTAANGNITVASAALLQEITMTAAG